jgi:hypothetical protein
VRELKVQEQFTTLIRWSVKSTGATKIKQINHAKRKESNKTPQDQGL